MFLFFPNELDIFLPNNEEIKPWRHTKPTVRSICQQSWIPLDLISDLDIYFKTRFYIYI